MKTRIQSSRSGFTLLEIMLVVMIIALLASAAIYLMGDNLGIAQDVKAKSDIQAISTQLTLYRAQNGFYPSTQQGIAALVNRPDSDPVPNSWRQLMKQVPMDPWGNQYGYASPGSHNADFDLYSYGADRKPNTADDIGNWSNSGNGQQ